jgi:hypothetical protein
MSLIIQADPGPSTLLSEAEVAERTAIVAAEFRHGRRTLVFWAACVLLSIAGSASWPWGVA